MRPSLIRFAQKSRLRTGRGCGLGPANSKAAVYFDQAIGKGVSRAFQYVHGYDTGLEGIKLLRQGRGQKTRQLDKKKVEQLTILFHEKLVYILSELEATQALRLEITKVHVPHLLYEVKAYWKCKGDETDGTTQSLLESIAPDVRRRLSSEFYGSSIPPIKFVPDRIDLIKEQMDKLFELADYGMQYRAVSQTASILGSKSDKGDAKDVEAKVPGWKWKKTKN